MNTKEKALTTTARANRIKGNKYFENQKRVVFNSFSEYPKTMLLVSEQTGIRRANVCRYVAELERDSLIMAVKKSNCPVSKHPAKYYYTIPKLF